MIDVRVRTRIPAEFETDEVSGKGEVRNVSAGGLFVGTLAIPREGATASVRLQAPGKAPVQVGGLVWWTAPAGIGTDAGFGLRVLDGGESYIRLLDSVR